jgi:hypothetical protein
LIHHQTSIPREIPSLDWAGTERCIITLIDLPKFYLQVACNHGHILENISKIVEWMNHEQANRQLKGNREKKLARSENLFAKIFYYRFLETSIRLAQNARTSCDGIEELAGLLAFFEGFFWNHKQQDDIG